MGADTKEIASPTCGKVIDVVGTLCGAELVQYYDGVWWCWKCRRTRKTEEEVKWPNK